MKRAVATFHTFKFYRSFLSEYWGDAALADPNVATVIGAATFSSREL
jgi:hypothetical protein